MRIRRTSVELGMTLFTLALGAWAVGCDKSDSEKKPAAPPSLAEIPKGDAKSSTPAKPAAAPDAGAAATPAKPADAPKQAAPADPHANMANPPPAVRGAAPKAQADVAGSALTLVGITMTIPEGWVHEPTPSGPMAAAAVFKLPKAEGDADDGMVRVTHFPNMKGMDDSDIQRWLGQVSKADGTPNTMADAKLTTADVGPIKLTTLDVSGNVKATMRAEPMPNGRMLAVIVDHPEGPHFVVATGSVATVKRWETSVDAFLKSAKVK